MDNIHTFAMTHSPNNNLVARYFLNNLKSNIGRTTPEAMTTNASGTKTYHKPESSGSLRNTALATSIYKILSLTMS